MKRLCDACDREGWAIEDTYDTVLSDLNALEQAIIDICDIETVHAIQERKRMIQKK